MKSVGEAMAIGRTFKESLQKGLRSLEIKKSGLESLLFRNVSSAAAADEQTMATIYEKLRKPNAERIFYIADALRAGVSVEKICELSMIDKWFVCNIKEITDIEKEIAEAGGNMSAAQLIRAKQYGFSDKQISLLTGTDEAAVAGLRKSYRIAPDFKLVDTCAAEFQAYTPYYYSTYDSR
jgi:carbamoyl-phosphate synthase large subunit